MLLKNKKCFSILCSEGMFRFLFFFIMIPGFIFLTGCNNENAVNPSQPFNVTGKVTDYQGTGIPNVKVEISSDTARTSSDGSFTFSNIIIPYEINVYPGYSTVETFRNLNTAHPILPVENFQPHTFRTNITFIMPPFNSNQKAVAMYFDDSGKYNSKKDLYNTNFITMEHGWNGNTSTSGKAAVWVYTVNNYGKIVSYDKYGEKPLMISNGVPARVVFNNIDLNTNPVDTSISGTTFLSPGFVIDDVIIGMNRNPFGNLYEYGYGNYDVIINNLNFSVSVPYLSGNVFKYYAFLHVSHPGISKSCSKVTEVIPNQTNYIGFNIIPSLILPADNEQNVNFNTQFSFSKDSPIGIYKVSFDYIAINNYILRRNIYLNTETFKLSSFSDSSYNIANNSECQWFVTKITGYNSADEYVSTPPGINPKYKELLFSERRTFKTKFTNK